MGWLRDAIGRLGGAPAAPAPQAAADATPSWRKLGNEALGRGDLAEAARCYAQGVLAHPEDAALRLNHGFTLLEQGQFAPAAQRLREALALRRPGDGCEPQDAYFLLARAQAALGEGKEAVASLEFALKHAPAFVEALEEIVRMLDAQARHREAAQWMERLVAARPTTANRLVLASQLRACGHDKEAIDVLTALCAQEPGHLDAALMRSAACKRLGRFDEALDEAQRMLQVHGADARLLVHRAALLERMGRNQDALADLHQALALAPGYRDALVLRCAVLTNLLRLPEAIAAGEQALQQLPEDADLHFTWSLALLAAGDLRRGWREHEWRLRGVLRGKLPELADAPLWTGQDLRGRTLFVYGEQGIGDEIQFVRYLRDLGRSAASVLVMVTRAFEPLLARSLPPNCRLLPQNSPLPPIDFHCALMSVPAGLGSTLENLPTGVPYLQPDPVAVRRWQGVLGESRFNVGVVWSGNPKHTNDHHRSIRLADFRALAAPGCRFVNLQPQMREADAAALAGWPDVLDAGRELVDMGETAALVQALDLVVTVDTSVAHLAGALGKPVWILLPHAPDWRWMVDREDSPWYPTARLYRQPRVGDWATVLGRVRTDLAQLAGRHPVRP